MVVIIVLMIMMVMLLVLMLLVPLLPLTFYRVPFTELPSGMAPPLPARFLRRIGAHPTAQSLLSVGS